MNTTALLPHDYRSQMQALALDYLQAHQDEHLCDNENLAQRAVQHLVLGLDVPVFMAPRLVALALTELPPRWVALPYPAAT